MNNMKETFIAYVGSDITRQEMETVLKKYCAEDNRTKVKTTEDGKVIFGKNVRDHYSEDRDPNSRNNLFVVSGCDLDELYNVIHRSPYNKYNPDDNDKNWALFAGAYRELGTEAFSYLEPDLDFSVAIWDYKQKKLIVGRGNGDLGKEANLFYGYTKGNGDVIFSNNRKILYEFCEKEDVKPFPTGSYYMDGKITSYLNPEQEETTVKDPKLIRVNRDNASQLINGLNELLLGVTYNSVKERIEENIETYINEGMDSKQAIRDALATNVDEEMNCFVSDLVKSKLEGMNISDIVQDSLSKEYSSGLRKFVKKQNFPYINVIKLHDMEIGRTGVECFHEKFEEVLEYIQLGEPVMLIGPAGSGKNHSIAQIAKGLNLNMYYTNNASNEFKLTGFIDAGGTYRETEFYKAFKNGGIFFLDEIDNSDPSALIVINSALANGYMAFPHETIFMHPNFRMVAAANTWGKGADLQYVGRNALDGATLDRFDNVFFDYDRKLEESLYPNHEVLDFMWAFRDSVESTKTPHIVSTRGIGKVYKKEINGIPVERILRTNIIRNLDQDDLNSILGNMRGINNSNKYYSTCKSLRIGNN